MSSIENIINIKIRYEMGQLYNYLNHLEDTVIYNYLNAQSLNSFYGLRAKPYGKSLRRVCPFHDNASNTTEFIISDEKNLFHCHSCKSTGTYIMLIALLQGYGERGLNEAKIFAAKNFANINLGFDSIDDYKEQIKQEVLKRYSITNSLRPKDYFDISLLPQQTSTYSYNKVVNRENPNKSNNLLESTTESPIPVISKTEEVNLYNLDIENASVSLLLSDIIVNKDNLGTKEKLDAFMSKKYFIHGDIIDKYELIYFSSDNRHLLSHTNFYSLNDRVLFPIKDHESGDIVGLQGRYVFYNKTKNANLAKYLNIIDYGDIKVKQNGYQYYSTTSLHVGQFLFNLYETKNMKLSQLWITEGIADSLKFIALGYENVVSPGQSNLTNEHINLIKRYFGLDIEILLFFDNDDNNVGQNSSILKSYKLWDAGFRAIKIVRTQPEQGTDLTDVAVKLQDDSQLKLTVNTWEKNAYIFSPANNDDIDILINSFNYTETQAHQVDPRYIKELIENLKIEAANVAPESCENTDDSSSDSNKTTDSPVIEPEVKPINTSENTADTFIDYEFEKISKPQLYRLKQKFDILTIKEIDDNCTNKQITAIVANIVNEKPFRLSDYLHTSNFSEV